MVYDFDEGRGQTVGSHIRMSGRAFGVDLFLDEVITHRDPPHRKVWRTVGAPKLIIIGSCEMGFRIIPDAAGSRLTVWIDYDLPDRGPGRWAPAIAAYYGRWCVRRMVSDALVAFASWNGQMNSRRVAHLPPA